MSLQMNGLFSKIILGVGLLGAIFSSGPLKVNIYVDAIMEPESNDVNISAILDSFQIGYNKILRPDYGDAFRPDHRHRHLQRSITQVNNKLG